MRKGSGDINFSDISWFCKLSSNAAIYIEDHVMISMSPRPFLRRRWGLGTIL